LIHFYKRNHKKKNIKMNVSQRKAQRIVHEVRRMYSTKYDLLIVGGGIMGASAAHWISQKTKGQGFKVGVVEPDPSYATSATTLSVGGLRQQFSLHENVQIGIFARDFMSGYPHSLLLDKSQELHPDLPDVRFQRHGYLFLASEAGQHILEDNHRVQQECGARTKLLTAGQLSDTFSWLNTDGVVSGCYGGEDEGWFDPWALLQAFKLQGILQGVEYICGSVEAFQMGENRIEGARVKLTAQDTSTNKTDNTATGADTLQVHCDNILLAAGGDSGKVGRLAGMGEGTGILATPIPIEKRKRYVYVPHCPSGPGMDCPLVIDPTGVYFRREGLGGNYLCGQSPTEEEEPGNTNLDEVDMDWFMEAVWPVMAQRAPAFETLKVKTAWAGNYDYNVWDQNGIIGRHPQLGNVFMACGFSGHGIQQGPAVGRAMSELILDGKYENIDLSRFGFERLLRSEKVLERNIV